MTEKLYERDSLLRECQAEVLSCKGNGEHYEIVLDRTVIFPEGGGQLSDEGMIDDAVVTYAAERNGVIVHYADKPKQVGLKVKVSLNWDVRLDHMQQHCGEHILSYAFWRSCGTNNVGFHMNKDLVTIDLDKEVTAEEIKAAELMANAEIWANKPVRVEYLPDSDVAKLNMRKKNEKIHGLLRVVTVENGDICTCCGTHPPFTGMIGLIKVFRFEKHKGGVRIEFGCGKRALIEDQKRYEALLNAGHRLSVKLEDVPTAVENLKNEIAELAAKVKEKTVELFNYKLPEVLAAAPVRADGSKIVCLAEECDSKSAKLLFQLLTDKPGLIIGLVTRDGDRVSYQFAVTNGAAGSCRKYCQKANEIFNGKGGGSESFAQGGGLSSAQWREKVGELRFYIMSLEN